MRISLGPDTDGSQRVSSIMHGNMVINEPMTERQAIIGMNHHSPEIDHFLALKAKYARMKDDVAEVTDAEVEAMLDSNSVSVKDQICYALGITCLLSNEFMLEKSKKMTEGITKHLNEAVKLGQANLETIEKRILKEQYEANKIEAELYQHYKTQEFLEVNNRACLSSAAAFEELLVQKLHNAEDTVELAQAEFNAESVAVHKTKLYLQKLRGCRTSDDTKLQVKRYILAMDEIYPLSEYLDESATDVTRFLEENTVPPRQEAREMESLEAPSSTSQSKRLARKNTTAAQIIEECKRRAKQSVGPLKKSATDTDKQSKKPGNDTSSGGGSGGEIVAQTGLALEKGIDTDKDKDDSDDPDTSDAPLIGKDESLAA